VIQKPYSSVHVAGLILDLMSHIEKAETALRYGRCYILVQGVAEVFAGEDRLLAALCLRRAARALEEETGRPGEAYDDSAVLLPKKRRPCE